MTTDQDRLYMLDWCMRHKMTLQLNGECGFGRACVGVMSGDTYPDYEWHDEDYARIDQNGDVWRPGDAYHKHPCVAVLGRGEAAERQLCEWLRWFDANGFVLETGAVERTKPFDPFELMLGKHEFHRMVRKTTTP